MDTTEKSGGKRKKVKSPKERDRNKEYQKERYVETRDDVLASKKERYDSDPEYRARIQAGSKRDYWLKRRQQRERKLPNVSLGELAPSAHIRIQVDNPADARHGELVEVPIYTTTHVSRLLGRTAETMRVWLNDGVLPSPAYRGADMPEVPVKGFNPRLFTEDEMQVIQESRDKLLLPDHGRKHALFTTAVAEGFASLHQGLVLVPAS